VGSSSTDQRDNAVTLDAVDLASVVATLANASGSGVESCSSTGTDDRAKDDTDNGTPIS